MKDISLSESQIRVIKVALRQHWRKMVDDNGETSRKDLQPFADCCYETYEMFDGLDKDADFEQLA